MQRTPEDCSPVDGRGRTGIKSEKKRGREVSCLLNIFLKIMSRAQDQPFYFFIKNQNIDLYSSFEISGFYSIVCKIFPSADTLSTIHLQRNGSTNLNVKKFFVVFQLFVQTTNFSAQCFASCSSSDLFLTYERNFSISFEFCPLST